MPVDPSHVDRFDHADYATNPDKYRLFRTARIAGTVFRHSDDAYNRNDIPAGEYVRVTFKGERMHKLYRRVVPVFTVTRAKGETVELSGECLGSFCL